MKSLLTLLLFTLTPLTFGQAAKPEPCNLMIAESPVIRGLKLGMAEADFKKKLGGNPDPIVTRYDLGKLSGYENIQSIGWELYNQRLMRMDVTYDDSITWNGGAEFAEALSGPLDLPQSSWKFAGPYNGDLDCKEFTVSIDSKMRRVRLFDKTTQAAMKEDELKKQADKKKAFKP
jgi:hypothetical protein